jgi:hypothetical protein
MQRPLSQLDPALKPREFDQHLGWYALAAAAAGVGILGSSQPSEAEIVYTPVHQQITPNSVVKIDLNDDGIYDFAVKDTFSTSFFSSFGRVSALPIGQGNQVRGHTVGGQAYASALFADAPVGPNGQFLAGSGEMAELSFLGGARHGKARHPASVSCTAPWANVTQRYLGLKFVITGEVHFGWARINVTCSRDGSAIIGLLTGYAYETVANRPILTGREQYDDDFDSAAQEDRTSPEAVTVQPAGLGRLAQGASGMSAWRNK